jgi:predicted  nucleic acid-binding Zn-ribbon protein
MTPTSQKRRKTMADDPKKLSGMSQKTQTTFLSLHVITVCCHAVLNTQFVAPDPKPDWFDDLDSKLDNAKVVAQKWIDKLGPEVTSGVPTSVIDYSTTYSALTDQIHSIAQSHPTAQGKDNEYVKQINELVTAMLTKVGGIITNVEKVATDLADWGKELQAAHDALTSGAANIQKAEVDLQSDIDKMNNAINNLNAEIDAENKQLVYAQIAVGVGIFLLVAGVALAVATGGAGAVVAGVGVLAIAGGATAWGIIQSNINDQFDEIAKDQKEMAADKQQLVALQSLGQASNQAVSSLATASQALSDFRTIGGVFEGELKGVQTKLNQAEQSLATIVQDAFTQAAAKEWADAEQLAQDLAEVKVDIDEKQLQPAA